MPLTNTYTFIKKIKRTVLMTDAWNYASVKQKGFILISELLTTLDSAAKLIGPMSIAKAIDMVSASEYETQWYGITCTSKDLLYFAVITNLAHCLLPSLRRIMMNYVKENTCKVFTYKIKNKSQNIAINTDFSELFNLQEETNKHLICANYHIMSLLESITETIHPMLIDTALGITVTFIQLGKIPGIILFSYIAITTLANEFISYHVDFPKLSQIIMTHYNKYLVHIYNLLGNSEAIFLLDRILLENKISHFIYSNFLNSFRTHAIKDNLASLQSIFCCFLQLIMIIYISKHHFDEISLDHILFLFSYVLNIAGNVNSINNSFRNCFSTLKGIDDIEFFLKKPGAIIHDPNIESNHQINNKKLSNNPMNELEAPLLDENNMNLEKKVLPSELIMNLSCRSDIAVQFDNVSFSYETQGLLLDSISFTINTGETVGIIGASNCGKTTITKLLCGLLRPINPDAKIRLFGYDISQTSPSEIRKIVSIVRQKTNFFREESVKYNILYGFADDETLYHMKTTRSQITIESNLKQRLTETVQDTHIEHLLDRENCHENTLSGGEEQRIAIARILARNSSLFIFDEPTSQLDLKTEIEVLNNIKKACHNKTTIMIAHRLSAMKYVNKIIVFKNDGNGTKIVEQGTHEELIKKNGEYAELWNLQTAVKHTPR